ncbi:murein transglycosylase A [Methyloversatilis thermotolerans]|uniref:murein transglycosylase A n=1 Tax=Methyloversatilis thermotolerans TaxID=1346290 RepID=UPI00037701ED|nr:murein transglycosylase A [Methyloversatilis thermotolerans]
MFQQIRLRGASALICLSLLMAACSGTPVTAPPIEQTPVAAPACPPAPVVPDKVCPACPLCPACPVCPAVPAPEAKPQQARLLPADWKQLDGWQDDDVRESLPALRASCSALASRAGWRAACSALEGLDAGDRDAVRAFYETHFRPWQLQNGDGSEQGLITGYYEPLLKASRTRGGAYTHPIHAVPDDLLVIDLASVNPDLKNMRLRGRIDGRKVVPYWSRAELDQRAADLERKVLFWATDALDVFFLQVQGSGQVELPDGSRVRVGYADQNGHPYASIGRWLVDQGELKLEQASMQGIRDWARAHPARVPQLLAANPSYVFFRELPIGKQAPGLPEGPLGALGVPLAGGRVIAVDPRSVPLGAPVWLDTTRPNSSQPLRRLMMAQDTGGAIKGGVRADFFWGFGPEAGAQAGRMKQQGRMWVLLPDGITP